MLFRTGSKPKNIKLRDVFSQYIAPNGTFTPISEVNDRNKRRYFTKNEDRIYFGKTCYVVSGEWGPDRHKYFVEVARGVGYTIKEVG